VSRWSNYDCFLYEEMAEDYFLNYDPFEDESMIQETLVQNIPSGEPEKVTEVIKQNEYDDWEPYDPNPYDLSPEEYEAWIDSFDD